MNGKQLVKLLEKRGWVLKRIAGSHHVMEKAGRSLPVPVHGKKDLHKETLHKIMKDGGIK